MANTKYLIFDFDGVLGDTLHAVLTFYCQSFGTDYQQTHELMKTNFEALKKNITPEYLDKLAKYSLENASLFTDFFEQIAKIPNAKLAIVSLSNQENVEGLLVQYPNLKFDYILCGWAGFSKIERVNTIFKNWGVLADDTYFFADTLNDVHDLKNIFTNNNLIGCHWGFHGREVLMQELSPNLIIDDFAEIHNIIENKKYLRKTYKFLDFTSGFNFVSKVSSIAEEMGHHPTITLEWGKVTITSSTHDKGNVTELDYKLMDRIALLESDSNTYLANS